MTSDPPNHADGLGGRLPLLEPAQLSDRQASVREWLTEVILPEAERGGFVAQLPDGRFVGPFNAWLRVPEMTMAMARWAEEIAAAGLSRKVREVVILTVGAHWSASFEIYAHRAAALAAGVPEDAVDAILAGKRPTGLEGEADLAQRFTDVLLREHDVPDSLYKQAVSTFGEAGLVALLSFVGLYQAISGVLVAFRVPAPDSAS